MGRPPTIQDEAIQLPLPTKTLYVDIRIAMFVQYPDLY